MYRITNVNVLGGQGMVATQNIPKGALILKEDPLLVVDTQIYIDNWNGGTAFFNNERASITNRIRYGLRSIDWRHHRHRFRLLEDGRRLLEPYLANERVRNINIVKTNAWNFKNPGVNENTWLVVLGDISRVNHSCAPNSFNTDVCTEDGHFGRMKLIARKDIELDEEIVIEYTKDVFWLQPCHVRRQVLQRGWGFECHCNACEHPNFTDNELRYLQLAEIYVVARRYTEARKVTISGLEIEGWYYDINEFGRQLNQMYG